MSESLKQRVKDAENVMLLHEAAERFAKLLNNRQRDSLPASSSSASSGAGSTPGAGSASGSPTSSSAPSSPLAEAAASLSAASTMSRRAEAGLALRLAGPLWRAGVLVAIVNDITQSLPSPPSNAEESNGSDDDPFDDPLEAGLPTISDMAQVPPP